MKKMYFTLLFLTVNHLMYATECTPAQKIKKKMSPYENILMHVDNRIATFFSNKTPYFRNFQAVKDYVKKTKTEFYVKNNKKIIRYCCPYEGCTTFRDKNVTEVASCLLTHYSSDFFYCPSCPSKLKKIECLKQHLDKFCPHISEPNMRPSLPKIIIKLKKPDSDDRACVLPRLIITKPHIFENTQDAFCNQQSNGLINEQIIVSSLEEFHSLFK